MTFAGFCDGAYRADMDIGFGVAPLHERVNHRGIILRRVGVGHGADGCEASSDRCVRRSFGIFLPLLAGCTEMGVKIDETRCDNLAFGIEFCPTVGQFGCAGGFNRNYRVANDNHIGDGIESLRRIDDPAVPNDYWL